MNKSLKEAVKLHRNTPPNWYQESIRVDLFQRFWHQMRFSEVSRVIEKVSGKILDVGCADGTFSKVILDKSQAESLIGIDVLKSSIDWANKHWRKSKMRFLVSDAHRLKFDRGAFEAVFALEVLEHVADPERVLKEIKRVMKKGGYSIFLVPSDSFLFKIVWFFWLHFYPRGWVWNKTHIQSFKNNYLAKIAKKVGFKIEVDKKFALGMLHLVKVRK